MHTGVITYVAYGCTACPAECWPRTTHRNMLHSERPLGWVLLDDLLYHKPVVLILPSADDVPNV